jgi:plastocyanin
MKKVLLFIVLAGLLISGLLAVTSCGTSSQTTPGTGLQTSPPPVSTTGSGFKPGPDISIENFAFSPDTVTIAIGTTVTWKNKDSVNHTVTSQTGVFDSGTLSNGGSFSFTFTQAGTFEYHCSIHTSMHGTVIVQ